MMSTGFQRLEQEDAVDSDMDHLLPSWLCSDGVCSGKMPGCSQADFKIMHFPVLVFHFNREFKFDNITEGKTAIKTALAYAFSTLPEWVEIAIAEVNASLNG